MSEFMGNVYGTYDAKEKGFTPGCSSLHSQMTPHGPETDVFEKVKILNLSLSQASNADLKPQKLENTMSFMFESTYVLKATDWAMDESIAKIDHDYYKVP